MRFSDAILDEIRSRLPVSEVVGRRVELKRKGSEYVGLSPFKEERSPSFTVNDDKQFYHDFSSGKHGDIFAFLMETEGVDFQQAVETLAAQAGVALPTDDGRRSSNGAAPRRQAEANDDEPPFDPDAYDLDRVASPSVQPQQTRREITKTYDYANANGDLLYQVCRMEWVEEGGRRKKTFMQRRPAGDGHWIWGLSAGEFLQSRNGDWYQATKDRVAKWKGAPRRYIASDVKHGLFRLAEMREEAGDDTVIFLPEGEKDVETLREMGLVATTNSGGAKNWSNEIAEAFRGRDVVILLDNDDPGRERGTIIGLTLAGVARRTRVLDIASIWDGAPKGADVSDWARQREGTADELMEVVTKLPTWTAPPFISRFGGLSFEDLDLPGPEHGYVIDGWITTGDKSVIGGASLSGKSFLAIHMAMCIATGRDFYGCKVMRPGLVIYQAGEGGRGIKKRFRAWRDTFGAEGHRTPIYIQTSRIDIHAADGDIAAYIEEVKAISRHYNMPVVALFVDTLAKASGAADENSSRDMGAVMGNIDKIADALPGCHVSLVHHLNAGGTKLRGHTSVYAGVDQVILVAKEEDENGVKTKISTAKLDKQKDDEDGATIRFEIVQIEIGHRPADGKPITSCVTLPAGQAVEARSSARKERTASLTDDQANIYTALQDALAEHGVPPPPVLKLPKSIAKVVTVKEWYEAYRAVTSKEDAAVRQAMARASDKFVRLRIMGRINPWVWVTNRPVGQVARSGETPAGTATGRQEEFPEIDNTEFAPR